MAVDTTEQHLLLLSRQIRPLATFLVNEVRRAGYPLIITSSLRTPAEQAALIAAGRSATAASRHLEGMAFDVDVYRVARDRVPTWFWSALGPFGERIGLRWGGRWRSPYDPGHFEL